MIRNCLWKFHVMNKFLGSDYCHSLPWNYMQLLNVWNPMRQGWKPCIKQTVSHSGLYLKHVSSSHHVLFHEPCVTQNYIIFFFFNIWYYQNFEDTSKVNINFITSLHFLLFHPSCRHGVLFFFAWWRLRVSKIQWLPNNWSKWRVEPAEVIGMPIEIDIVQIKHCIMMVWFLPFACLHVYDNIYAFDSWIYPSF